VTTSVTVTGTAVPGVGVRVIVPVWVPTARLVGFTLTLADTGVMPETGVIVSQLPPATAEV
jgi:hypothetical protein